MTDMKKANPQNYSQPLSRLLCNLFFFFFLPHAVWLEACLECLAWWLLITSAPASIRPFPLITGLLLSWLGVPVLSLITRCIYSGYALLYVQQMHAIVSNRMPFKMSFCAFCVRLLSPSRFFFLVVLFFQQN